MTHYAVLFEVDVWHDYGLNRGGILHEALSLEQQAQVMAQYASDRFLKITPTATTARTLAGQQLLFRPTPKGFLVGVKLAPTASESRPLVPLAADFQLTFALQVIDPYFFNYTALHSEVPPFHWLSNESGNAIAGQRFLSAPVSPFDPERAYQADELYSEPAGETVNLFRSRRDMGPTAPDPNPISDDWEPIPTDTFDPTLAYPEAAIVLVANQVYRARQAVAAGSDVTDATQWERGTTIANQYVTSADRLAVRAPLFNLDLSSAALTQATVRILRGATTAIAWEQSFESGDGPLATAQVTLSSLPPGRYRLEVLDAARVPLPALGFDFYLDATARRDRWLGVIHIGLGNGDFALLDGAGSVRSPRYRLRFLNRASRWRYRFPADQAIGTGADVVPETPDNQQVLVTAQPLPLTRFGTGIRLQAEDAATPSVSEEVLLPQPDIRRIQRQNAQWYSDIYLSNLSVESA
ncbi:MAG: hypothetical protein F6K00_18840 [Leptolyngbya sp. SIOISBB]|nr:hypothetical protein [Leptolyngbya sp. SIOISBB]